MIPIFLLNLSFFLLNCFIFTTRLHAAINRAPPNTVDIYDLSTFAYSLTIDPAGCHSIYWSMLNQGTSSETLHMALVMNVSVLGQSSLQPNAWVAVGFGSSMQNSDMIIAISSSNTNNTSPRLGEWLPTGAYESPVKNPNAPLIHPIVVSQSGPIMVAVFNRQTGSQSIDSTHASLTDTSQPINMIWSFNAQPPSTAPLGWSFWHGNNRGSFSVNLQSGDGTITTGISIVNKRIHGLGMALAWLILMPLGVFLSRYYRFKNNWMLAHISLQVSALLLVLSMLILIVVTVHNVPFSPSTLSTGSIFPKLHSIFGFTLFSLLFCQGLLGCLNRLGLEGRNEMVERARPVIKQIHNWSGRTLLLIGYIQVGFGIQILYPVSELANRGLVVWILYGIIKGISLIAFIAAETFYQRYLVNHSGYLAVSDDGKRRLENATIHSDHLRDHLGDNVDGDLEKLNGRKLFSWAEIDASIKEGQVYVVANGRYVFDAGSWLSNHPGGQSILKAVAGTDITIDYFHESGYDAKVFIPDLSEPINKEFGLRRRIVAVKRQTMHGMYQSLEDTSNIDGATSPSAPPRKSSAFNGYIPDYRRPRRQSLPLLTPAEQKLLTRCRRSHSHSELALSKLAKYFVGEMSTPANQFDPLEYRRYGIVSKTLITTETSSTPVYRFKFCLLYPYSDVRVGEPDHFSPGQCIEILATNSVDGGEVITRYYTPINGSLTSFEVDVKCEKRGKMSNFLKGLRCGDKQIKIRGPFGRILLDVDRPLFSKVNGNSGKWCYDKIVMVVAGSGMAPAHQMLQYLFLNTHRPLYVHQNYSPENLDEIELQISDFVVIVKHYMDGWAEGINLRTGAQGILPLPCTYPICGPSGGGSPMVTIINSTHRTDDIFGVDTLDAAKCAYPDHLRLIHFVAKNQPKQHEPIRMGTTVMTIRDDDASTTAKEQKSQLLNTFEPVLTKMDNVLYKAGYTTLTEIPGSIISKRLDADSLYDVLLENQLTGDSILGEDNRLYVVCGPDEFNGRFYDTLVGRCRVPHSSIAILPSNKF